MSLQPADRTTLTTSDDTTTSTVVARRSRRHFVRVGVMVPVILTVASRSALAQTCLSPSASESIKLHQSRPDRPGDVVCMGRSPTYWKSQDFDASKMTKFSSVFPGGFSGSIKEAAGLSNGNDRGQAQTQGQGHSIGNANGNVNHKELTRYLAAAWCNLQNGLVSSAILDMNDLTRMWAGRNGSYAPIEGGSVMWGEAEIVDYLKTTMY